MPRQKTISFLAKIVYSVTPGPDHLKINETTVVIRAVNEEAAKKKAGNYAANVEDTTGGFKFVGIRDLVVSHIDFVANQDLAVLSQCDYGLANTEQLGKFMAGEDVIAHVYHYKELPSGIHELSSDKDLPVNPDVKPIEKKDIEPERKEEILRELEETPKTHDVVPPDVINTLIV